MVRPDIYKLARMRLADRTVNEYSRDLQHFLDWIRRKRLKPNLVPEELDPLLTQFAVEEFEKAPEGLGIGVFTRMKCGLEFYVPEVKGKLTLTEMSLQGWRKRAPTTPHPICPEQTALLIAHDLCLNGDYEIATGVLVAFDCYLRIGDLCRLTLKDVILMDDNQSAYPVAFALEKTKTGRLQCALLRPDFLAKLVKRLVQARRFTHGDEAALIGLHANTVSNRIRASRRRLGLEQECTMHSFRYGGATRDTISGTLLPEGVMHRGRWRSKRTMSTYVRPAEYMRNIQMLTPQQRELAENIRSNPHEHFNVAPPDEREFGTDRNLAAEQPGGDAVAHPGHMLTL